MLSLKKEGVFAFHFYPGSADLDFNPIHVTGTETLKSVDWIVDGEKRRFTSLWLF